MLERFWAIGWRTRDQIRIGPHDIKLGRSRPEFESKLRSIPSGRLWSPGQHGRCREARYCVFASQYWASPCR